ncbi:MAG: hypothetical protein H7201_15240 [Candidatus Saccharibacteria bacterium]|nr:hypothetical protein [Microbacteriaceae bacterium]
MLFLPVLAAAIIFNDSQWWPAFESIPRVSSALLLLCAVLIGCLLYVSALLLTRHAPAVPAGVPLILAAFGLWLWIIPAALIAVALWMWINSRVVLRDACASNVIWTHRSSLVLAIAGTATSAGNLALAGSCWP